LDVGKEDSWFAEINSGSAEAWESNFDQSSFFLGARFSL
jgi:hypothetical protein